MANIAVSVYRGLGDIKGDDIENPLISTVPVALAKGRNVLESTAQPKQSVDLTVVYNAGCVPGTFIMVDHPLYDGPWFGKVVSVDHRHEGVETVTYLTVEKY